MKMKISLFIALILASVGFSGFKSATPVKENSASVKAAPTASFSACCSWSSPNSSFTITSGVVYFTLAIYYGPGAPWSSNNKIGTVSSDCWPLVTNRTVYVNLLGGTQMKFTFTTTGDVYLQHTAGPTPGYGIASMSGSYTIANT